MSPPPSQAAAISLAGLSTTSPKPDQAECPPSSIQLLAVSAAPTRPVALSDEMPIEDQIGQPSETVMKSVRSDDVSAALIAHIHDSERNKPIFIDMVGSRNAVKHLLARAFNPANLGRSDGHAFSIIHANRVSYFHLPDANYKMLTTNLTNRIVEGRLVSLDATATAPRTERYVLVSGQIHIPQVDLKEPILETWFRYVQYRQTPNRPEFAKYQPPTWAADLYNVYQALRASIGLPLHVNWIPWLFEQVVDKPISSTALGITAITLCKYIHGYVDPRAKGLVEGGAYRLTCQEMSALWAEVVLKNPNRTGGIHF